MQTLQEYTKINNKINKQILLVISLGICLGIFLYILNYYNKNIEFYAQILNKRKIQDYTRWILSDKYIAKEYAKLHGFKTAKTYQLIEYPQQINFEKLKHLNYVIKPCDLCDSKGVYLIKDNINLKTNKKVIPKQIINELLSIRSNIFMEYYMHDEMYNGLVPYTGYIVEELLLDNGEIPYDFKCYVFNKKIHYIAVTYNRKVINGEQTFNSVWFNREWKPIKWKMIKKGYKYQKLPKPKGYEKMINIVEKMAEKLDRHCRIDIYMINGDVYLGEFTFFTGAILHSFYCNMKLGLLWNKYPDNYNYQDKELLKLVPNFYTRI